MHSCIDECERGTDNCDNVSSMCYNGRPGYSCISKEGYRVVIYHNWRDPGTYKCRYIDRQDDTGQGE